MCVLVIGFVVCGVQRDPVPYEQLSNIRFGLKITIPYCSEGNKTKIQGIYKAHFFSMNKHEETHTHRDMKTDHENTENRRVGAYILQKCIFLNRFYNCTYLHNIDVICG